MKRTLGILSARVLEEGLDFLNFARLYIPRKERGRRCELV